MGFTLDGRFDSFSTEVSLNDTSVRSLRWPDLSVYGDGAYAGNPAPVTTRNQTEKCSISVKGVSVLELIVTNSAGEPRSVAGAHSVWIEPYVIGRK